MILGSVILIIALTLSSIAAYYSIVGLAAIFAAATLPIVVMASVLEVAKVAVTVWLHHYWSKCRFIMKTYLTLSVVVLMFITSLGIYGFLSKAHTEQSLISGDNSVMLAEVDRQIEIEQKKITDANAVIAQLDQAVESLTSANRIRGADGAISVRNKQSQERKQLTDIIADANKNISTLQQQRVPLLQEQLTIEAKVGPLKYIAALIYGDAANNSELLEKSVRWVILLLVFVFDPLAVMMVLAAVESFKWAKASESLNTPNAVPEVETDTPVVVSEKIAPTAVSEQIDSSENHSTKIVIDSDDSVQFAETNSVIFTEKSAVFVTHEEKPDVTVVFNVDTTEISEQIELSSGNLIEENVDIVIADAIQLEETTIEKDMLPDSLEAAATEATTLSYTPVADNYVELDGKIYNTGVLTKLYPELKLSTDSGNRRDIRFGTTFPPLAFKNERFLRVDFHPTRLFRFDGRQWIEIDKAIETNMTTDKEYIKLLISKISNNEYDPSFLTDSERKQIEDELRSTDIGNQ